MTVSVAIAAVRQPLFQANWAIADPSSWATLPKLKATLPSGPKRFGPKGKLAYSFGDVAQDEGSAMAQFAWNKGWRTAAIATDTVIVYFKNVTAAFSARFKQLGGKIVDNETY